MEVKLREKPLYSISMLRIFDTQRLLDKISEAEKKIIIQKEYDEDAHIEVEYIDNGYRIISGQEYFYYAKQKKIPKIKIAIKKETIVGVVEQLFLKIKKERLNPMEMAILYEELFEFTTVNQTKLAQMSKRTQGAISNKLRLLQLPQFVQLQIIKENLTERHGRALLQLRKKENYLELSRKLVEEIINKKLKVTELEKEIAVILGKPQKNEVKINLQELKSKRSVTNLENLLAINQFQKSIDESVTHIEKYHSQVTIESVSGLDEKDYIFVVRLKNIEE